MSKFIDIGIGDLMLDVESELDECLDRILDLLRPRGGYMPDTYEDVSENEVEPIRKVPTLVFSRVCGYFQPTAYWNKGKRQEFSERVTYDIDKAVQ
jgi:hypothetical protein